MIGVGGDGVVEHGVTAECKDSDLDVAGVSSKTGDEIVNRHGRPFAGNVLCAGSDAEGNRTSRYRQRRHRTARSVVDLVAAATWSTFRAARGARVGVSGRVGVGVVGNDDEFVEVVPAAGGAGGDLVAHDVGVGVAGGDRVNNAGAVFGDDVVSNAGFLHDLLQ